MTRPKRRLTSSKVPQKVALPAYRYSPSKSPSPDEAPQLPGSAADSDRGESMPPDSPDQDESGTDQSHSTTSSSGDFPRMPVRPRQRFAADEISAMEKVYRRNKRPSNEIKQRLARRFGTSVNRIQIWFQNRRAKKKKRNNNPGNQREATTADEQEGSDDDDDTTPSDDPEQPEASTSLPSSKRQKTSQKSSATPPVVPGSSSSATKKWKKQKMPAVPAATVPATHSLLPSGSYTVAYPGYAPVPMQPMDPPNVPNTPIPNESFLFQSHHPQHPSHARGYFVPSKYDWRHPHIIHPSLAPAFQELHPTEKPPRYVDPKKVIKPESYQPVMDHLDEQGPSSSIRPPSRKGKQNRKLLKR
ncbi:Homeodomain-like DNA binding domain-containing protein-containing transcription factor [Mucor lusitanicus]